MFREGAGLRLGIWDIEEQTAGADTSFRAGIALCYGSVMEFGFDIDPS